MKTRCYSYDGKCPCIHCHRTCCVDNSDKNDLIDTDGLCPTAKEYCEKLALLAKESEHENYNQK